MKKITITFIFLMIAMAIFFLPEVNADPPKPTQVINFDGIMKEFLDEDLSDDEEVRVKVVDEDGNTLLEHTVPGGGSSNANNTTDGTKVYEYTIAEGNKTFSSLDRIHIFIGTREDGFTSTDREIGVVATGQDGLHQYQKEIQRRSGRICVASQLFWSWMVWICKFYK